MKLVVGLSTFASFYGCQTAPLDSGFTIKPDDFADGTLLKQVSPQVTLTTAGSDNVTVDIFDVTATDDGLHLAPTGQRVFGHVNIPFFNNNRRLRMDFSPPASQVRILFAGGTFGETEIGRLQAFNAAGQMIAEYVTSPRGAGEVETMTITHPIADIAWAVAFEAANEGSFGRLDDLSFVTGVP